MWLNDVVNNRCINILCVFLCVIEIALIGGIMAVDSIYIFDILDSVSFVAKELFNNGGAKTNSMMIAVFAIEIIYASFVLVKFVYQIILHCCDIKKVKEPFGSWLILFLQASFLFLFAIASHSLFLAVVTCLDSYYQNYIRIRAGLSLLLMIVYIIFSIIYANYEKDQSPSKARKLIGLVSSIVSIIVCIVIVALNIVVWTKLTPGDNPSLNVKDVSVGLFNKTEIDDIGAGKYVKDEFYEYRILAHLDNIVHSKNKTKAYTECHYTGKGTSCTTYYYRRYEVTVNCTAESELFFFDCKNSTNITGIVFRFEYLDDKKAYPKYNCAYKMNDENETCLRGCDMISKYSMIMIEEKGNDTQLAWKNFGKCTVQPRVSLTYNKDITPCASVSSSLKIYFITYFVAFIFLYNVKM